MPDEVKKEALRELDRLTKIPAAAAEYTVCPHLHRLADRRAVGEAHGGRHRPAPHQAGARRGSLRAGSKVKERILEYLAVRKLKPDMKGPDPLLRGTSGRRQDVARRGRSPARSGASSSACRSAACGTRPRSAGTAARTSAPCPARSSRACGGAESKNPVVHARRDRQARRGLPRRSRVGAARGARSGAEQLVPRSLPRCAVRPLRGDVHHDGEHAGHGSAGRCAIAWRSSSSPATPRKRSWRSRASTSSASR